MTYIKRVKKICGHITTLLNINTYYIDEHQSVTAHYQTNAFPQILSENIEEVPLEYLPEIQSNDQNDLYMFTNEFQLSYLAINLKQKGIYHGTIYAGPFLVHEPTRAVLRNLMFKLGLTMIYRESLKQFYESLKVFNDVTIQTCANLLNDLVESIDCLGEDASVYRKEQHPDDMPVIAQDIVAQNPELYFDIIEKRYEKENDLLHAVETGDYKTVLSLMSESGFLFKFSERVPHDPQRSQKNISFVLNTLLRKAAENGGVHPVYIDSISSKYAVLIEALDSTKAFGDLHSEMVLEYCNLVNKLSLANYSPFVKKIIEHIRINLHTPLTLESLAQIMASSPSKISRTFKNEVGDSIVNYINELRVSEAIHLMGSNQYNITDIAYRVGFNDANYFSKIFKKIKGMTPSEFMKMDTYQ